MSLEELLLGMGGRRMGSGPELGGLGGLLTALLASKMGGGPSCGPEEFGGERSCEECPLEGNCPMEAMKRAMGESGDCSADGVKNADLLITQAKVAGLEAQLEAQVELLGSYLTQFRKRVDKMDAAHKAEAKRLTDQYQAEIEHLTQMNEMETEGLRGTLNRTREQARETYGELEAVQGKVGAVQHILSNGHSRPRDILAALRRELGMPPLPRKKAAAASSAPDKTEGAGE